MNAQKTGRIAEAILLFVLVVGAVSKALSEPDPGALIGVEGHWAILGLEALMIVALITGHLVRATFWAAMSIGCGGLVAVSLGHGQSCGCLGADVQLGPLGHTLLAATLALSAWIALRTMSGPSSTSRLASTATKTTSSGRPHSAGYLLIGLLVSAPIAAQTSEPETKPRRPLHTARRSEIAERYTYDKRFPWADNVYPGLDYLAREQNQDGGWKIGPKGATSTAPATPASDLAREPLYLTSHCLRCFVGAAKGRPGGKHETVVSKGIGFLRRELQREPEPTPLRELAMLDALDLLRELRSLAAEYEKCEWFEDIEQLERDARSRFRKLWPDDEVEAGSPAWWLRQELRYRGGLGLWLDDPFPDLSGELDAEFEKLTPDSPLEILVVAAETVTFRHWLQGNRKRTHPELRPLFEPWLATPDILEWPADRAWRLKRARGHALGRYTENKSPVWGFYQDLIRRNRELRHEDGGLGEPGDPNRLWLNLRLLLLGVDLNRFGR